MKKIIITALVIFSFASVEAQKGFHFGIRGTTGSSMLFNKQDSDNGRYKYAFKGGGKVGVTFTYNFTDKLGVGTGFGANYVRNQPQYVQGTPPYSVTLLIDQKENYLYLPIYFHVNSNPDKVVMGYFYIGPEFNFFTKAEMTFLENKFFSQELSGSVFNSAEQQIFEDAHSKTVIGAGLGCGIQFNIKDIIQIYTGLALSGTFTDLYTDDAKVAVLSPPGSDAKYKHWSATLSPTGPTVINDNGDPVPAVEGIWSMDRQEGTRGTTYSALAGWDFGVKYTLRKKK